MNDIIPPRGHIRSTPRAPQVRGGREHVRWARPQPATRPNVKPAKPLLSDVIPDASSRTVPKKAPADLPARRLAKTAYRADVLARAVQASNATTRKRPVMSLGLFRPKVRSILLGSLAVVLLAGTAYVGFDTLQTNQQAKAQLTGQSQALAAANTGTQARQNAEGSDTAPLPQDSLKNYVVASNLPRAIYINKIKVAARVLPMSVNPDGSVQAPINIYDSGWYNGSVEPGQVGAMFIDGHASGATNQGLFGNLHKLVIGDTLQIEKGDGTRLTYRVVHTAIVDRDKVDMKQMLLPYGNVVRGLNLITCTGTWVPSGKTLTQRVEVFTEQIN